MEPGRPGITLTRQTTLGRHPQVWPVQQSVMLGEPRRRPPRPLPRRVESSRAGDGAGTGRAGLGVERVPPHSGFAVAGEVDEVVADEADVETASMLPVFNAGQAIRQKVRRWSERTRPDPLSVKARRLARAQGSWANGSTHDTPVQGDVLQVARGKSQTVDSSCRGDQAVDDGSRIRHAQTPPLLRDGLIDGKNPVKMLGEQLSEPRLQNPRRVSVPQRIRSISSNLADRQDRQKALVLGETREPARDMRIAAVSLSLVRKERSCRRDSSQASPPAQITRPREIPVAPTGGISRSLCLSDFTVPFPFRASRRISRCSASAECPQRAARSLSFRTSSGSRFRTMSCADGFRFMISMISLPAEPFEVPSCCRGSARSVRPYSDRTPTFQRTLSP